MDKKKPEIRFKGFEEEWVTTTLGECFQERVERSAEGELISVTINQGVIRASDLDRIDNSSDDKSNYKVVEVGDIAYNSMRMWQGACGYSLYKGICSPAYTVVIPQGNINVVYCFYMFKRNESLHLFRVNSQGLTSDTWNLKFPAFSQIKYNIPSVSEQEKIGTLLTTLDKLIAKLEAKLEKLRKLKQALLEKMFINVNGGGMPEIRFKGYPDKWEVKELREVANLRRGLTYSPDDICKERKGIRVLRSSNVAEDIFFLSEDDVFVKPSAVDIPYLDNNDILITAANGSLRLVGKHCLVTGIQPNSCVPGGFMLCASTESPFFLQASMSSSWYQTFIDTYTLGGNGSIGNLSKTALEEQNIHLPSIPEQQCVGHCFMQIDTQLSKSSIKLTKLRRIKESLLEKMFV